MTLALEVAYGLMAVLLCVTRLWLRYPVFTLLIFAYVPALATWDPQPGVIPWQAAVIGVLKFGAVMEALKRASEDSFDEYLPMFAGCVGGAAAAAVSYVYQSPRITDYQAFHDLTHWFLGGFCVAGAVAAWRFAQVDARDAVHGLILTAFILNHVWNGIWYVMRVIAGDATGRMWLDVRTSYQIGCLVLIAGWAWWSMRYSHPAISGVSRVR